MSSGRRVLESKDRRDSRRDRSRSDSRDKESSKMSSKSHHRQHDIPPSQPSRSRHSPTRTHDRRDQRRSRSGSRDRRRPDDSAERRRRNPVEDLPRSSITQGASNPIRRQDDVQMGWRDGNLPKEVEKKPKEDVQKEKPNFASSGKLLEDTNLVNGVVINYAQPPEARIPKVQWRFYPFKGEESLPTMYLHRQSAYLLGRDRRVADIPLDHPSCSKQHAVIQFRLMPVEKPDGTVVRRVKPYIIDLNSGNGTMVNGEKIETQRYVELLEKDVVKFGFSSREYVMLHEGSKDDEYRSEDEAD